MLYQMFYYRYRFSKLLQALILTLFCLFASMATPAYENFIDDSPLLADTQIIAGDPGQDEFFIVEIRDVPKIEAQLRARKERVRLARAIERRLEANKIERDLNHVLEQRTREQRRRVRHHIYVAQHKTHHSDKKLFADNESLKNQLEQDFRMS